MFPQLKKVAIVVDGCHLSDDICLDSTHFDFPFWTSEEDTILISAVATIGRSDWSCIANIWLDTCPYKNDYECQQRWEVLRTQSPTGALPVGLPSHNTTGFHGPIPHQMSHQSLIRIRAKSNAIEAVSIRKRRELEALEERRLFGKQRNEIENHLIHRAYLIGLSRSKTERVLMMNGACPNEHSCILADNSGSSKHLEAEEVVVNITVRSMAQEMGRISPHDVEQSIKTTSKGILKLPKAVLDLSEEECYSPDRQLHQHQFQHHHELINQVHSCAGGQDAIESVDQILDLERHASNLPIHSALQSCLKDLHKRRDTVKNRTGEIEKSNSISIMYDDDDCLPLYSSPPLCCPFPSY